MSIGRPGLRALIASRGSARLGVAFCLALVVFAITLNFSILNPTHVDWCLSSDTDVTMFFFSFAYYRHAAWTFPIAHFDSLSYPIGSSLLVMDGLPLAAVPLKLVDRWLPDHFQFLGPWLFLNIWLQGLFAERFLRKLQLPAVWSWGGALLAVTAPPFIARFGHVALSSHWILLVAMTALCSEAPGIALWIAPTIALWIHPYLFAIVLALSVVGQLRFARVRGALPRLAFCLIGVVGSLWVLGYFALAETRSGRFEYYSADLTSLVNSMGGGRFLPSRALGDGAWEGSAYLGCGGLVLCAALLLVLAVPSLRRKSTQNYWLLAASLVMAVYSLSIAFHFLGKAVVRFDFLWPVLEPFAARFRSCGRFIWPLYYYLLFFGLKALWQLTRSHRIAEWCSPAILVLQLVDTWPALGNKNSLPQFNLTPNVAAVPDEIAQQLSDKTQLLIFVPPVKTTSCGSRWHGAYQHLAWFGALHGLKSNANLGQARSSRVENQQVCVFTNDLYRHKGRHPEAIFIRR